VIKSAITTAAATPNDLPVTLAEAKSHLRITSDNTDGDNDAEITQMIKAATEIYERAAWIEITPKTRTFYLDDWQTLIEPQVYPLRSVTTVKYYDADNTLQTLSSSTGYEVDLQASNPFIEIIETPTLKDRYNAIEIACAVGFTNVAAIPPTITRGLRMLIGDFYEYRLNNGMVNFSPDNVPSKTMDYIMLHSNKRFL